MKKILAIIAAAALCLVIAGCAGNGTLSDEIIDETGAFKITADDAGEGSALASLGGGLVVEEGQIVVVSPDLEKGSLTVKLLGSDGNAVLDQVAEGRVLSTAELAPGDYSVEVTCDKNGTTGTLMISAIDRAEFEQQNQALDDAVDAAGEELAEEQK
ncbi:MAG: hypothetical protein ACOYIP_05415 [Coriobacteriales bacterium]|jgi:hypothetical protein